ncbi:protein of unknown function [Taphrina deformans PYCC 5710]|uniref:Phytase n=1 Tax=Taphrina deformans (strain PYCC 5710 / ATCC 11124 / CBS 356.35 / IMI 108563 / JCM 9778 / NBRC 8474) TaxID=1097556 RepID=R4XG21_TAPDE|nr:protein of unknown function [Taphrina deformans PYCC 5710]|eukprot:CCG84670.1 protein of unknown function [Taphrina deformans PYCC 5710]
MVLLIATLLGVALAGSSFKPSEHWGQTSPYRPANFGIDPTGLPAGCSYEQIHVLQRHTERYPTSGAHDAGYMTMFAAKVNRAKVLGDFLPLGRLEFLRSWEYELGTASLTPKGAAASAQLGAEFWSKYGRLLYEMPGEVRYNTSLRHSPVKPVFRTTNQARMLESARWYISGFFSNPNATSSTELYDLVIIPEGGTENNTLAAYDSCPSLKVKGKSSQLAEIGVNERAKFITRYAARAQKRLQKSLPKNLELTTDDVFGMQSLCAYEMAALGASDFCDLFKEQDWRDYDYALSLSMYAGYSYGHPTGRAQGLGYVQELIARLQHRTIDSSTSSVNTTFDNNESSFGHFSQPVIFDATHDAIIISVMTAMGLKFFNQTKGFMPSDIGKAPKKPTFRLSALTPFGAKLHTEVISCPQDAIIDYSENQLKYSLYTTYSQPSEKVDNVEYIRMKLNEGVLPIATELGCQNEGAKYGFCTLSEFLRVLEDVEANAQYDEVCYGSKVSQITGQVSNGNMDSVHL